MLPNARLVCLERAAYLGVVRAFLTGRPLASAPWDGGGVPTDQEGPP